MGHEHKYMGHETANWGGRGLGYTLFNTYLCNQPCYCQVVVEPGAQLCTLILSPWRSFLDLKLMLRTRYYGRRWLVLNLRKRMSPRVSSSLNRWVDWDRSGLTVEMKPGLIVSVRLSLTWPWAPRSWSLLKSRYRLVVAGSFNWIRWETTSVLVPFIRLPKRLMTGWLSNWLTFSTPHITPRHNTLLKAGVDIVGISNWKHTLWTRRVRFLWSWTSGSPTTFSELEEFRSHRRDDLWLQEVPVCQLDPRVDISVLVPPTRVSKRHTTGWLINSLTFSTQHTKSKHNRWLKVGVIIVGTSSGLPTSWMRRSEDICYSVNPLFTHTIISNSLQPLEVLEEVFLTKWKIRWSS